jgi:predicted amidohydrolase
MRVALYPFDVSEEPQRNLELVRRALEQAAHEGAELLVLPELWISSFAGDADAIAARAAEDERLVAAMQAEASPDCLHASCPLRARP